MSKGRAADHLIALPASRGWSLWRIGQKGTELLEEVEATSASELLKIPAGELTMVFPVRQATALPMKAKTADEGLFGDLTEMHVERCGMRPDENAGNLFDYFLIQREGDEAQLLPVVLAPQLEDAMPRRSPAHFDVSPRIYPMQPNSVTVWRELGRLVFAIKEGDNLAYFQGISSAKFDAAALQEIKLAKMQLGLQGFNLAPEKIVLWDEETWSEGLTSLESISEIPIVSESQPQPVLPEKLSKLLPADVSAARRRKKAKQRNIATITALALLYLGLLGFGGYKLWNNGKETKALKQQLAEIKPQTEALESHIGKWDELEQLVDSDQWPVELLFHVKKALPGGGGIRFKTAEIAGGEIRLDGEAQNLDQVKRFNLQLKRSASLSHYKWDTPSAQQTRDGRWGFIYTGKPNTASAEDAGEG